VAHPDNRMINLVRRAKKGDQRAFDKILKELEPDIKKKINRFYIRGGESADVLQEARIGLWKAIEDFNEEGGMAFRYFAVNLCVPRRLITQISSANRNKFKLQNDAISLATPVRTEVEDSEQSLADFIQDDNSDMLSEILIKEQFAELSNLLNTRLTPLEKSVFEKYAEEDSYKDIAKSLDQTPKAVDNALMRIRKKAREVLLAYENGVLQETIIFEESIIFEASIEIIIEHNEDPQ
jgi:RNA polymerase sporulation-specific sigma factor